MDTEETRLGRRAVYREERERFDIRQDANEFAKLMIDFADRENVKREIDTFMSSDRGDYNPIISIFGEAIGLRLTDIKQVQMVKYDNFDQVAQALANYDGSPSRFEANRGAILAKLREFNLQAPEIEGRRLKITRNPAEFKLGMTATTFQNVEVPGAGAYPFDPRVTVSQANQLIKEDLAGMPYTMPMLRPTDQFGEIVNKANSMLDSELYKQREIALNYKSNLVYEVLNSLKKSFNDRKVKSGGEIRSIKRNADLYPFNMFATGKAFFPTTIKIKFVGRERPVFGDSRFGVYMGSASPGAGQGFIKLVSFGAKSKQSFEFSVAPYFGYVDSIFGALKAQVDSGNMLRASLYGANLTDAGDLQSYPLRRIGADLGDFGRITVNIAGRNMIESSKDYRSQFSDAIVSLKDNIADFFTRERKITVNNLNGVQGASVVVFTFGSLFNDPQLSRKIIPTIDGVEQPIVAIEFVGRTAAAGAMDEELQGQTKYKAVVVPLNGTLILSADAASNFRKAILRNLGSEIPQDELNSAWNASVQIAAMFKQQQNEWQEVPKPLPSFKNKVTNIVTQYGATNDQQPWRNIIDSFDIYLPQMTSYLDPIVFSQRAISAESFRPLKVLGEGKNESILVTDIKQMTSAFNRRLQAQKASIIANQTLPQYYENCYLFLPVGLTSFSRDGTLTTAAVPDGGLLGEYQFKIWVEGFSNYDDYAGFLQVNAWLRNYTYSVKQEKAKIARKRVGSYIDSDSKNLRKLITTFGGEPGRFLDRN